MLIKLALAGSTAGGVTGRLGLGVVDESRVLLCYFFNHQWQCENPKVCSRAADLLVREN
jgi:hypothetical protein